MYTDPKATLFGVLTILNKKKIPLDKILLHKFIYYLQTQGVNLGFRFEPYTYGPFSFDLASTIGSLAFWDVVKEGKADITILDESAYPNPFGDSQYKQIQDYLDDFKKKIGSFDFNNLEYAGTVLYCAESLAIRGKEVNRDSVIKEYMAWKPKSLETKIADMYERLQDRLPGINDRPKDSAAS